MSRKKYFFIFLILILFLFSTKSYTQTNYIYSVDTTKVGFYLLKPNSIVIFNSTNILFNNASIYEDKIVFNSFLMNKTNEKHLNKFIIGSVQSKSIIVKSITANLRSVFIVNNTSSPTNIMLKTLELQVKVVRVNNEPITLIRESYEQYLSDINNNLSSTYYNKNENFLNITVFLNNFNLEVEFMATDTLPFVGGGVGEFFTTPFTTTPPIQAPPLLARPQEIFTPILGLTLIIIFVGLTSLYILVNRKNAYNKYKNRGLDNNLISKTKVKWKKRKTKFW